MHKSQVITTFLPVVEEHEQTAAWRLFHVKYRCRVARIHTESLEFTRERPAEGNEYQGGGLAVARDMITVTLSAAAMAEMIMEGAQIALLDEGSAKSIYLDVHQHLKDWQQYSLYSVHGRNVPEDDLRALDQLAAVVYPHARYDIAQTGADMLFGSSKMADVLGLGRSASRLGIGRFTAKRQEEREADARGSVETAERHNPMVDAIIANPRGRTSKWGAHQDVPG